MADKALNARDAKLVQWLLEAHVKEAELEADLVAHISLTQKDSYRKRLQAHLKETRDHKKRVETRVRQLGGSAKASSGTPSVPGVPGVVGELAGKALAGVKGQIGMARAAITEQSETHLRNAQEEFREEHVEIALYTRIEALAEAVGDRDTATLARAIRREEERMAKFLAAEITRLVKDVVKTEIPRDQRAKPTRRRTAASGARGASTRSGSSRAGSRPRRTSATSRSSSSSRARASGA